jgi:hypothetical protein
VGTSGTSAVFERLWAPRWRGQPGRLEVWYATVTDAATGTGFWVHHEVVSPTEPDDHPPYAHGWAALFPPDGDPVFARFGPGPAGPPDDLLTGEAGAPGGPRLSWHLAADLAASGPPLFTFPRWAWERELLPGAQVVPAPVAPVRGTVTADGRTRAIDGTGGLARIYGHGNAQRWAWLHADLGAGEVCEIVAAVPRRPGLRRLPVMALVRLRLADGAGGHRDWPPDPLAAAPLLRARVGLPTWTVGGVVGRRRLRVRVEVPPAASVAVGYRDPDGAPATCTNSERASATIRLEALGRRGWFPERSWDLRHTAHAEVGDRGLTSARY